MLIDMTRLGEIAFWAVVLSHPAFGQPHYDVEWIRGYGEPQFACGPDTAVVDGEGHLWVHCSGHDYGAKQPRRELFRIDGRNGALRSSVRIAEILVPQRPDIWDSSRTLIAVRDRVVLLASMLHASSGRMQFSEGVYLLPMNRDGPPVSVVPSGAQLSDVLPSHDGNLILAADQAPLSIRKINLAGATIWSRSFSKELVLPTLAVFPDGSVCATAQQQRTGLRLFRLDPGGVVTQDLTLAAAQGTVAAGSERMCGLLYTDSFDAETRVWLAGYDINLGLRWRTASPIGAPAGRTYRLHALADGYLATGEVAGDRTKWILAKFSWTGRLEWTTPIVRGESVVIHGNAAYLISSRLLNANSRDSFRVMKIRFR